MVYDARARDAALPEGFWSRPETEEALARRDVAALFRLVKRHTGHSQTRIGAMTGLAQGHVSDIMVGGRKVAALETFERIAAGLEMPDSGRLLMGLAPTGRYTAAIPTRQIDDPPPGPYRPNQDSDPAAWTDRALTGYVLGVEPTHEEITTDRRDLLLLASTAVTSAAFGLLWSEPSRMRAAAAAGSISVEEVYDLQHEAAELAVQVIRVPPSQVLGPALSRFREVRELVSHGQRLRVQRELLRAAAMFATVVGEVLFNRGQPEMALRWYHAAQQTAAEAGDQLLADLALCGATYIPTYGGDPGRVLANVHPRLTGAATATPAVAWLWAFKAKAYAARGERGAFEQAVNQSLRCLDASDPSLIQPGIFSFLPEKLAMYEARGRVELGDSDEAARAADRAMALYDPGETTEPALAHLEHASALALSGEHHEGARIATAALLDPRTYHGVTVIGRARQFDRMLDGVPGEATDTWREVLRTVRPPQPAVNA